MRRVVTYGPRSWDETGERPGFTYGHYDYLDPAREVTFIFPTELGARVTNALLNHQALPCGECGRDVLDAIT